jgi:hypothetical protein
LAALGTAGDGAAAGAAGVLGVLGPRGAPGVFGALTFGALALAGGSGSGRGLPTCAISCVRERAVPDADGTAGAAGACGTRFGWGLGAMRGALPGPNTKTWPTEIRKSAPILFHRAKSRKSRS